MCPAPRRSRQVSQSSQSPWARSGWAARVPVDLVAVSVVEGEESGRPGAPHQVVIRHQDAGIGGLEDVQDRVERAAEPVGAQVAVSRAGSGAHAAEPEHDRPAGGRTLGEIGDPHPVVDRRGHSIRLLGGRALRTPPGPPSARAVRREGRDTDVRCPVSSTLGARHCLCNV